MTTTIRETNGRLIVNRQDSPPRAGSKGAGGSSCGGPPAHGRRWPGSRGPWASSPTITAGAPAGIRTQTHKRSASLMAPVSPTGVLSMTCEHATSRFGEVGSRLARGPEPRKGAPTARSAGLRPASRGSAKPALRALRPAQGCSDNCGYRPTSKCGSRSHSRTSRSTVWRTSTEIAPQGGQSRSARSAGLRPASRGSAKPALTALCLAQGCSDNCGYRPTSKCG